MYQNEMPKLLKKYLKENWYELLYRYDWISIVKKEIKTKKDKYWLEDECYNRKVIVQGKNNPEILKKLNLI